MARVLFWSLIVFIYNRLSQIVYKKKKKIVPDTFLNSFVKPNPRFKPSRLSSATTNDWIVTPGPGKWGLASNNPSDVFDIELNIAFMQAAERWPKIYFKFKTSEITTTGGETFQDGLLGAKPHSSTRRDYSTLG